MTDLPSLDRAMTPRERKAMMDSAARELSNRKSMLRSHPAMPGTGPAGETCRSCKHIARLTFSKTYRKCELMQASWTGGPGTDIRASDPACKKWEKT